MYDSIGLPGSLTDGYVWTMIPPSSLSVSNVWYEAFVVFISFGVIVMLWLSILSVAWLVGLV